MPLLGRLDAIDGLSRNLVASVIGQLDDRRVIAPVAEKLADSNFDATRRGSFETILRGFGDGAWTAVLELASSDHAKVRGSGIRLLGAIGTDESAKVLRSALDDSDAEVRCTAAYYLAQSEKDQAALAVLKEASRAPDIGQRRMAITGIGHFGAETAIPILESLASDADSETTSALLSTLGRFKEERATRAIAGLANQNPELTRIAVYALARQDTGASVRSLSEFLKQDDQRIRSLVKGVLARMRNPLARRLAQQQQAAGPRPAAGPKPARPSVPAPEASENVKNAKIVPDLAGVIGPGRLLTVDRQAIWSIGKEGDVIKTQVLGGSPFNVAVDHSGTVYFHRPFKEIVTFNRPDSMHTTALGKDASGYGFALLPGPRFAILDNREDQIRILDAQGKLIKATGMLHAADSHGQNTCGIVVGDDLIVCEDGNRKLLRVNLKSYEVSVLRNLSQLRPWLGQLVWQNNTYYVSTPNSVYSFKGADDPLQKLFELSDRNITGLVIDGDSAYVSLNSSGSIQQVNLKDGTVEVLVSGLQRPEGLVKIPAQPGQDE